MEAKAPLELSRKPVLALEVGCRDDVAVCFEKEPEKTDASKLAPIFLRVSFSACFARLRSTAPRTAALVACALVTPFLLRQKRAGFTLRRGMGNASCGWLHLITASGGADTIRHCHEVNKSSLHSVPHWNYIHLYLPKGSGGFRSPSRGSLWGTRTRKSLPLEGKVSRYRRDG